MKTNLFILGVLTFVMNVNCFAQNADGSLIKLKSTRAIQPFKSYREITVEKSYGKQGSDKFLSIYCLDKACEKVSIPFYVAAGSIGWNKTVQYLISLDKATVQKFADALPGEEFYHDKHINKGAKHLWLALNNSSDLYSLQPQGFFEKFSQAECVEYFLSLDVFTSKAKVMTDPNFHDLARVLNKDFVTSKNYLTPGVHTITTRDETNVCDITIVADELMDLKRVQGEPYANVKCYAFTMNGERSSRIKSLNLYMHDSKITRGQADDMYVYQELNSFYNWQEVLRW